MLLLFKGGELVEKGYAFRSVSYLYELIKQNIANVPDVTIFTGKCRAVYKGFCPLKEKVYVWY